jgi:histidinol dehydrogenase
LVLEALKTAAANIEAFHQAQREREMWAVEVRPGILAGRLVRPIPRVGCYIPGGLASYPSSALMNIIPARVAGVKEIIACTPPGEGMALNPATIAAAHLAGAQRLFKLGGPWAIGSLAYGTEVVPRVDKIVGPGNKYVTAAKLLVFGEVDIDSPAGPSEALIVADDAAEARLVAADFLSQVEHDQDAAAVLVTPSEALAHKVVEIILAELPTLPRRDILEAAIRNNSAVLVTRDLAEAIDFANRYAPEHLQIMTRDPFALLPRIEHAGSIFLGRLCAGAGGGLRQRHQPCAAHRGLRPHVFRAFRGRLYQKAHLPASYPGGTGGFEGHGGAPGRNRGPAPARPGRGRALPLCVRTRVNLFRGLGKGAAAILWRKKCYTIVTQIPLSKTQGMALP